MGVYAAMSVAGGAVGLIAGGLLTTRPWRWVLFVNVPIGVARLWPRRGYCRVARGSGAGSTSRRDHRAGGLAALVYGLSSAATNPAGSRTGAMPRSSPRSRPRWCCSPRSRSSRPAARHALMPLRLLADRDRTGANLIMLCVGAVSFAMFFFLTLFMQAVWGYSAPKTGLAYLPLAAGTMAASGTAAQLIPRIGARPLLLAGTPAASGGLYWLSRLGEHGSYAGAVLGPMLVIAVGLGLLFVPVTLVAMSRVADKESGVAASLRNTGQQVGGSIGLAVLGTVAWTVVANSIHAQTARAATTAARPATRRAPARQASPRSTTTPWPPGSPAPSWSPPGSCCSPWSSPSWPSGSGAPTSARPRSEPPDHRPQTSRSLFTWRNHETHDHRGHLRRRPGTAQSRPSPGPVTTSPKWVRATKPSESLAS